jgi:gliding motility-associated-like protein
MLKSLTLKQLLLFLLLFTSIISLPAQTLYWVGGSGNFNDPAHWSLQSGGAGGAKIPGLADDVHFDKNSFKYPSIVTALGESKIHNFIVEGDCPAFSFAGSSYARLIVDGSFQAMPAFKNNFEGKIIFTSNEQEEVFFASSIVKGDVVFDGSGRFDLGTFKTADHTTVSFNKGEFNLNGTGIFTPNFIANSGRVKFNFKYAVLNVTELFVLGNNVEVQDSVLFIDAKLSNLSNYQVSDQVHFSPNARIITGNTTFACTFPVTSVVNPTCTGSCDGVVTFNIPATCAGTTGPNYQATWLAGAPSCQPTVPPFNPSVPPGPFVVTGVCGCQAAYTVVFAASNGGFAGSAFVTVTDPPSVSAFFNPTSPSCNSVCDGRIDAVIIGGTQPYSVNWNPPNATHPGITGTDSIINQCVTTGLSQTYTVNITDANGCSFSFNTILTQPSTVTPAGSFSNALCNATCTGYAFVNPSGGNGGYTYQWDSNAALTNDTLPNLCAPSTHSVVVTDMNGCTGTYTANISQPLPLAFTPSIPAAISCADVCNGSANITAVIGGTPPYSFSWAGPSVPTVVSTATTSTATAMCAGTYTCTITDSHGCDTTSIFVITSPALLVGGVNTTNVSCFNGGNGTAAGTHSGGTGPTFIFNWFSATNPVGGPPFSTNNSVNSLTAGSYTMVVVDANGCNDTVIFAITQPSQVTVSTTVTNPNCFGATNGQVCANASGGTGAITLSWLPAGGTIAGNCYTNLGAGTYTVNVKDANNCPATDVVTLTTPPQIFPNLSHTNPTCNMACNGTATAAPTGGSGSGYTFAWSCSASTTAIINGQCAGSCTVTVTDGSGCSATANTTFVDPNPLTVTVNATTLNCAGASTAQIASTVNGGTAPYTYTWTPGGLHTPGLSNVGAGSYTLDVTDAQGCVQTASVTILSPPPISITPTPVSPSCFGSCNGSISTMLAGGTPPYTVLWQPTSSTNVNQVNLCAGTYTINVTDANSCLQSQAVVVTSPTPVDVTTDTTLTSCIGVCNGTATATATGGNGGYTYSWNNGQTTQTALALCDGTYTVTVTDIRGCTGSATATVTEPTAVTVFMTSITPSCSNMCTGTATINPGGGTPGYTFTLDGSSIGGTTSLSGLCTGTHTVIASDANGCTASVTFSVSPRVSLIITSSSTALTCFGDCNATATANVSGATMPITFSWMPTGQSTQVATGLCAGIHTVTVTDGLGCSVNTTVTFTNPPALTAPMVTTPVDCHGNCTGTAKVTPAGGTPPYTVTWSNGQTGSMATGLCVGSYTATIMDANGCSISQVANITQPSAFTVSSAPTPPSTCGGSNGSITVSASGGSGTFNYSWSAPGGNTPTLSNLAAGVYTLTLVDAITGCDTVIPFALSDPSGPLTTQSTTNVSCPGACIGSGTVNATTGVAPITVTWPGGTPSGTAPQTATNLCAGVYPVLVSDATTCQSYETVIITQPSNFVDNEVLTNITCNGGNNGSIVLSPTGGTRPFTYFIDGSLTPDDSAMTNLSAGTHTVVVQDANGCTYSINYILTQPSALAVTETHANISCTTGFGSATAHPTGGVLPYTYLWSNGANTPTAANLITGTYTCTVTDVNGCAAQVTVAVNVNPPLTSGFVSNNNLCSYGCSGTASFTASGGSGVYTYSWSGSGSTASAINGICPGTYTATVSDNNGCSVTQNYTITVPTVLTATASSTNPSCFGSSNGTISVTPGGGTPTYSYAWSPNASTSQSAVNLNAGSYTVTVIDANGCTTSKILVLTQPPKLLSGIIPTQPVCYGDCNGILASQPSGGTAPYTFSWGPGAAGSNDSLTGLCIGSYYVVVTDSHSCKDSTSITLTQPPQVGLTASSSAANCGVVPCDGSITINTIIGDTVVWLNSIPPGFTGLSQTNLCAGIYNIQVSDIQGCKDTVAVGVSTANGPLVTIDADSVSCIGNCNGAATVVSISGNAPYTFAWGPPIPDIDSIVTNLCIGTYLSQVTDGNGCLTVTSVDIDEPLPLDDHEVITSAACSGVNSGSIVLAPTGGTPPFHYAWSNGAPDSPSNTNLAPGSYSVTITDKNLCTYTFNYTVGFNAQIVYQLAVTNPSCNGQCNGTAVLNNVNGGSAPYTFVWSDGQSGTTANMLCAGNYTVTINDNVGCSRVVDTTLTEPSPLVPNPTVNNTACSVCAGTIALAPSGGTSSYSYAWSNGQTASTATGLCAGVYMVDITDALGCATQFSVALNNTNGPSINTAVTPVACGGQCTGAATATATGGTIPYQYNWISGGQTTASVSNMCAGTYFVQVKDGNNCVINDTVVITETTVLAATNTTTPTTCNGCNGAVVMAPTGGTAPYTYNWSTGSTASNLSGLCAGSYSVVVTDGAGCTVNKFITINSNNAPVVSVATDSVNCFNNSDGGATVSIIGGTPAYTISWSNGAAPVSTASGLMAGTYAVTVTDANLCSTSKTFSIEEPNPLSLSISNTTLPGCAVACNGAITAIPSGGTLGYTYAWTPNGASTGTVSGLCAGTYSVLVTDSRGCTTGQVSQLVNNPSPFTVSETSTNATCGLCDGTSTLSVSGGVPAYSFNWSNGNTTSSSTGLCAGVYMVDITDSLGCSQQYSVAISNSTAPTVTVATTDVSCAGQCTGAAAATPSGGTAPYQYNWLSGGQTTSTVTNLCAGTYFVQVKDANNCTSTQQVDINEQTLLTVSSFSTSASACGACDGTATLNATGGSGSFTYSWMPGGATTSSVTGLCAGIYTATVTDAVNGCVQTKLIPIISSVNAPLVSVAVDSVDCYGTSTGQATVSISGGVPTYTVTWSTGSAVNPTLGALAAGNYAVTVEDALGCVSGQVFTIEEPNPLSLSLNNTLLPSCAAACNGSLVAIPSGGSLSYSYAWTPGGATTDSIGGLCAGTYSVLVTDSKGCTISKVSQLNNNPVSFTVTPTNVNAACGACDGSSSLAVAGGITPYSFVWGNGDTGSSSDSLCAGVYPVNITDALGCAQQYSVAISNNNGPSLNVSTTDIACAGDCTGAASVTPSGGTTPYQYNWLSGGQTTSAVSNLCAGTYFVQVKDANNCTSTQQVDINEQTILVANGIATNATCNVCNGTITLSPTGGSGSYTYVWSNGAGTSSLTGLCAGTYSVEITDAVNGCKDTMFFAISNTNAPLALLDVDSVICNGTNTGQAILTISGGTLPYTITWSAGGSNDTLTGLAAGNYAVSVADGAGCVAAQTFTVEEPPALGLSLSNAQLPNCSAVCNGALTAIPSGGALPYTYAWSPGGATTDTLGHLCAGTYSVTITDQKGCTRTQTSLLVPNPTPFNVANTITQPGCNLCDGVIDITLSGGMPPFTYAWSTGSLTEDIDSVCAGLYQVSITDSVGCSQTISLPVSNGAGITGETIVKTDETCYQSCNGTATVTPVGGTPPYSYVWLYNGDTTNSETNLCANTYFLQISDSVGCIRTSQIDILSPSQMIGVPSTVSPTCGNSDGSITLNMSGGTGPLSYAWTPAVAGNTNSATGLAAGVYVIDVTDASACTQSFTVTLSNVSGPGVAVVDTDVSCYGLCDGSITLNITSPNPTTVLWNTGSNANPFTNLCEGNYTATITDNVAGCVTAIFVTITEPDTLDFSIVNSVDLLCNAICNGSINSIPSGGTLPYTFSWSPVPGNTGTLNNLCAATYTVSISDANGCISTQSVTLTEPAAITTTGIVTNASCSSVATGAIDITATGGTPNSSAPAYTYQWSGGSTATSEDLSSILYGTYSVVVTDANSCTDTTSYNVAALDTVIANAGADVTICQLGDVILDGSGSVINNGTITYQWFAVPPAGALGSNDSLTVTAPSSGNYSYQLIVGNSLGCTDTDTVALTVNPLPLADAGPGQEVIYGHTATIGGSPTNPAGTTVSWLPNSNLSNNTIPNPVGSNTVTTTYTVTVIDTTTGCVSSDTMTFTVLPQIIIPNGISPNGDGKNDTWIINVIYKFPNNEVEVYNRWGELLYSKKGYDNTWDGSYKGKPLPIGTYYYVVKLNEPDYPDAYTGPITIFK